MKKITFIMLIICDLFALQNVSAQNWAATLEHNGATQVFYGQNSFVDAYNASVNGDQIYLSAGVFASPSTLVKGVKVYGTGYFPIEGKQTQVGDLQIAKGADSLRLEGLYINGNIKYNGPNEIDYVKIVRCRLGSVNFATITNHCSFEECFISNDILFSTRPNNFLLRNSIIQSQVSYINSNALIEGNIFMPSSNYENGWEANFLSVKYSIIQNNIFLGTSNLFYDLGNANTNTVNKNLFVSSNPEGVNKATNYTGVAQTAIFVNQTGDAISYSHDYHLKTPETYIGTDGTQVGIYGGLSFKEKGIPSNPYIESKDVAPTTETNGNLKINISVKAQDN